MHALTSHVPLIRVSVILLALGFTLPGVRQSVAQAAEPGAATIAPADSAATIAPAGSGAARPTDANASPLAASDALFAWTRVSADGGPGLRFGQAMMYDRPRDRLIVFGGTDGTFAESDLWALNLSGNEAWQHLSAAGPSPRSRMGATFVMDASPPRLILFGGWGWGADGSKSFNDCWSLELGDSLVWKPLSPAGAAPSAPRNHHSAIYDTARDRMVIYGGGKHETWALTLGDAPTWAQLKTRGDTPPPLEGHTAVYDARRDRMLVFGGVAGYYSPLMKLSTNSPTKTWNEVWALSLADPPTWTKLDIKGPRPSSRFYHVAIVDTLRDRMLIISGGHSRGSPVSDIWALALGGSPSWSQLVPAGVTPTPRRMHAAAYEPKRNRVWLIGGAEQGSADVGAWYGAVNDVWWLPLGSQEAAPESR